MTQVVQTKSRQKLDILQKQIYANRAQLMTKQTDAIVQQIMQVRKNGYIQKRVLSMYSGCLQFGVSRENYRRH